VQAFVSLAWRLHQLPGAAIEGSSSCAKAAVMHLLVAAFDADF
jgi:hypothetical protein